MYSKQDVVVAALNVTSGGGGMSDSTSAVDTSKC